MRKQEKAHAGPLSCSRREWLMKSLHKLIGFAETGELEILYAFAKELVGKEPVTAPRRSP